MTISKRIPLLTLMQVFGCVCVIFGHSFPFVTPIPKFFYNCQIFVYCFHMPLFVFCSGVLLQISNSANKYTFFQFLGKRFWRLIFPYFALSLLGVIPKIILSPLLNDSLSFDFTQLLHAFLVPRENIWGHFWFLPMIFFLGLIGFWLSKLFAKFPALRWPVLILALFGLFLPDLSSWFGMDDLVDNFFFYVLGMIFFQRFERESLLGNAKCCVFASILLIASVAIFYLGIMFPVFEYLSPIVACGMIAATAFVLLPISRRFSVSKASLLNRTYSVFILSWPCQLVVELIFERLLGLSFWCIMPSMFMVGIIMPCLLILLIKRIERNMKFKIISMIVGG